MTLHARIQFYRFVQRLQRLLVSTCAVRRVATGQSKRVGIAWIGVTPLGRGFPGLFQVAGNVSVIGVFNAEPLRPARSLSALVRLGGPFPRQGVLSEVAIEDR